MTSTAARDLASEHVDVLVVGAGLSGIGAAYRLQHASAPTGPSPSSRRATRSAAPGTCSATPASAPTPTCSPSATRSGRGAARRRSPTGDEHPRLHRSETAAEAASSEHIRFRHQVVRRDVVEPPTRGGPSRARDAATGSSTHDLRGSSTPAPATTTTTHGHTPRLPGPRGLRRRGRAPAVLARGPRRTPASGSSSSAAARPP